jgi:hypothetical protein
LKGGEAGEPPPLPEGRRSRESRRWREEKQAELPPLLEEE